MKTCEECEHYEFYDGPESATLTGDKAIMFCKNKRWAIKPYYRGKNLVPCCSDCFTSKKPKEPEKKCSDYALSGKHNGLGKNCRDHPEKPKGKCMPDRIHWQPIEKPKEKSWPCEMCRLSFRHEGGCPETATESCGRNHNYAAYQPIEKPGQATKTERSAAYLEDMQEDIKEPNPPKKKEKTMIKRIRHLMRVIAILWCGYGLYLLGCISNPLIYKLWHLAPLPWGTEISQPGNVILPWLLTIAVIIAVIIISFVLHNFTKWFFGDK